jgi:integral membrane protein
MFYFTNIQTLENLIQMNLSSLSFLRILGNIEGVSYLLLLGVAMPMKYFFEMPMAVKIVGMAHGVLFIAYCLLLATSMKKHAWSFLFGLYLFVATLIPFGTFITDRKLKEFSKN